MNIINRNQISDGVFFSSIKDSRFKTMKISANMLMPLLPETASANAMLCGVLSRSCKKYPDFTKLSKKLSSLYGADLSTSVSKHGDYQVLKLSVYGLDDRYAINGESIACELSSLLCSVIFEPNLTENNVFVETEVEQERRQLLDLIDSEFNDKRIYANGQLIKNMCANEVFGIKRYGTADKIKEVTAKSLYDTWKNLLKTAKFEIMYIGDSPADKACQVFKSAFSGIEREVSDVSTQIITDCDDVKYIEEEMDVSQSKLVMGFRNGIAVPDDKVSAARLMCSILGGTANSKLFCNVREKQSLCYYCSSRYDSNKGILMIDSGVESSNLEKARTAILKEIEDMKNGVISDFEIESTKMAVVNSFKTTNDTVGGIESWFTSQIMNKSLKTVDEVSAEINAVTKEEIVDVANKLVLDTVYVLKSK